MDKELGISFFPLLHASGAHEMQYFWTYSKLGVFLNQFFPLQYEHVFGLFVEDGPLSLTIVLLCLNFVNFSEKNA